VNRHEQREYQILELRGEKGQQTSQLFRKKRLNILGEGARGGVSMAPCSGAVMIAVVSRMAIGVIKLKINVNYSNEIIYDLVGLKF
jgi:hypothetical protein